MTAFLWVLLGGALGSGLRFALSRLLPFDANESFPWGTFLVNILGCILIGVLTGCMQKRSVDTDIIRWFWVSGICGGFTTFSALSLETFTLIQQDRWAVAIAYTLSSLIIGVLVTWGGWQWVRS